MHWFVETIVVCGGFIMCSFFLDRIMIKSDLKSITNYEYIVI